MSSYKPHFACFKCRKTFKRRLVSDINIEKEDTLAAKCPQCRELMADMGLDFKSPKKDSIKEWEHIKSLYSVGITFHSCGCNGPGYIPNTKERLITHLKKIKDEYHLNLSFWRQREEPTNQKEIDNEMHKNWEFVSRVPYDLRPKKGTITNEDAKLYWFNRIKEIEQKLTMVESGDIK